MTSRTGDKEKKYLESILKERPDSLLFARLADAYRKEGNIVQAIELCLNGLKYYPDYTTGRILLGRCYLEQQNTNEAIEAFTRVCSSDRRNQVAIKMLADIFVERGMNQKAGDLYAILQRMDPDNTSLQLFCSRYASSGEMDLFSIIDGHHIPVSEPLPVIAERQDELTAPPPDAPDSSSILPSGDEFNEFFSSVQYNDTIEDSGISGSEVVDRMATLFDDASSGSSLVSQPEATVENNIESVIADIANENGNISGDDVSDRIAELFTDNRTAGIGNDDGLGAPRQADSGDVLPGEQEYDSSNTGEYFQQEISLEPDGVTSPSSDTLSDDFSIEGSIPPEGDNESSVMTEIETPDFKVNYYPDQTENEVLEGDDISRRFDDFFSAPMTDSPVASPTITNNGISDEDYTEEQEIGIIPMGESMEESSLPREEIDVQPFEEQTVAINESPADESVELSHDDQFISTDSSDTISGIDSSDQFENFFSGVPSQDEDELQPDFNIDAVVPDEEASVEVPLFDVFEIESNNSDESRSLSGIGFPDEMSYVPDTSEVQEESVGPTDMTPNVESGIEEVSDQQYELTGSDVSNRIKDIFEPEVNEHAPESVAEEPSGDDIVNRIDDLFAAAPSRSSSSDSGKDVGKETLLNEYAEEPSCGATPGLNEDQNYIDRFTGSEIVDDSGDLSREESPVTINLQEDVYPMDIIEESDDRSVTESISKDGSETTFDQLLPQGNTMNELFVEPPVDPIESGDGSEPATGVVEIGDDREDFSPSEFEETLQFDSDLFEKMLNPEIDDIADEESVQLIEGKTVPVNRDIFEDEQPDEEKLLFGDADPFSRRQEIENQENLLFEVNDDLPPTNDRSLSMELLSEAPTDEAVFDPTDEIFTDRQFDQNGEGTPDLIHESTATFEVTSDPDLNHKNLVHDYNEGIIASDTDEPERGTFTNPFNFDTPTSSTQPFDDGVDLMDSTPSGDDIVGKLDAMFQETSPKSKPQKNDGITSKDTVDLTKEYRLDELTEMNTDESEDENDAALVETIQLSDELAGPDDVAIAENEVLVSESDVRSEPEQETLTVPEQETLTMPEQETLTMPEQETLTMPEQETLTVPEQIDSDSETNLGPFFPAADLMDLSSGNVFEEEEDAGHQTDAVADFYTLSGEDAIRNTTESLPDSIDQVEFVASDILPDDRSPGMTKKTMAGSTDHPPARMKTTFSDEMLPDIEASDIEESDEDFPQETVQMNVSEISSMSMDDFDESDKPFSIPDHVLTPTLANIYCQQGQHRLALQIFSRLLQHDPENARLISRYNEIKAIIEQGGTPSVSEVIPLQRPGRREVAYHKKNVRQGKSSAMPDDGRPLAGVRIKKQAKTIKKNSGKKKI